MKIITAELLSKIFQKLQKENGVIACFRSVEPGPSPVDYNEDSMLTPAAVVILEDLAFYLNDEVE